MKYLLLNKTLPENPEYGHYVSYTDSTDKVEYSFGYSTTNSLDRVVKAITGLSAILTDHDICIYGRGQGYSDSFWLTYGGELQGDPGTGFTWFPGLSGYQDNTGREVNLNKLCFIGKNFKVRKCFNVFLSAEFTSPTKSKTPGVSRKLILTLLYSTGTMDREME